MTTALITGASEGLGEALALALSRQGFSLILVARNEEKLNLLASTFETPPQVVVADLCDPHARSHVISVIRATRPTLIINNAGCGLYGPAISHPTEASMKMIQLNVEALVELSLEGAKTLIAEKKSGTILNISSAAAFHPFPTFCIYAATKVFVNSFSQGLDAEMKPHGIRVLTVCPGQIATGFRSKAAKGVPQKGDHFTMSTEKAVTLILRQLERGTSLAIIDGWYRWGVYLSRCLPKAFVRRLLMRSINKIF